MTYEREDGTRFHLGTYSPEQWATIRAMGLRDLNERVVRQGGVPISEAYIERLVDGYRKAVRV